MKEAFSSTPLWIKFARMTAVKMACLYLAAALCCSLALAQGQGVVEGRLVNGTNPSNIPARLPLDVIGLGSGMNVLQSAVADSAGRFRIEGLPTDAPVLISVTYQSVQYFSRASFDTAGRAHVEVQIYEPTISWQGIRAADVRIAFKLGSNGLRSLESYTFINATKPPQSLLRKDGSFRFSKAPGILEPPRLSVAGPGSSMPVAQAPLESADGLSYYSLYPLRPGTTTFEVAQWLPYQNQSYTYRGRFYQDIPLLNIGVSPQDMAVAGEGLTKIQTNPAQNFAVYSAGPFKAGDEVVWKFSGGSPVQEEASERPPSAEPPAEPRILAVPTPIAQNAMIIGPLLFLGFILVLWYAYKSGITASEQGRERRIQELKARREQLLDFVAALDIRNETQALDRKDYLRLREQGKRHLRRIATLLAKK